MKKFLLYSLSLIIILLIGGYLYISLTPPASPLETVNFSEDNKNISITYSRPYKKGRLIFGNESDGALVPYDKYWRTGANNHTTIDSDSDLIFKDNILPPGTYSIYTFPGKDNWKIVFNETNSFWGIMQPDAEKDLFSFSVPSITIDESIEQFTIDFIPSPPDGPQSNAIRLRWDLTEIVIPFK
jgi:hypothetical protein